MEPGRRALPGAIQVVDLYHAGEHLWELARKLHPNGETHQKRWITIQFNGGFEDYWEARCA